ncbi:MAG: hypothetical protein U1F19_02300 [Lysobacterales bacterium]
MTAIKGERMPSCRSKPWLSMPAQMRFFGAQMQTVGSLQVPAFGSAMQAVHGNIEVRLHAILGAQQVQQLAAEFERVTHFFFRRMHHEGHVARGDQCWLDGDRLCRCQYVLPHAELVLGGDHRACFGQCGCVVIDMQFAWGSVVKCNRVARQEFGHGGA